MLTLNEIKEQHPELTYGLYPDNPNYEEIIIDRYERKIKANGHYVITRNSKNRGVLYIQDPRFSKKYMWTQFENNALIFNSEIDAINYMKEKGVNGFRIKKINNKHLKQTS